MISFKSFIEEKKTKKGDAPYVILDMPTGIMAPDGAKETTAPVTEEADGSKHITQADHNGFFKNGHSEGHKNVEAHSDKLHNSTAKSLNREDKGHVKSYTNTRFNSSKGISKKLIDNHNNNKDHDHGMSSGHYRSGERDSHHAIRNNAKSIGHETHLYSGVHPDFAKKHGGKEGHIVHSPAHISTSHDIRAAHKFANRNKDENGHSHIMHIHAKSENKGLHVSKHSASPSEHETIIPHGAQLKYSHTTTHEHDHDTNKVHGEKPKYQRQTVHVHHYTIHKDGQTGGSSSTYKPSPSDSHIPF